MYEMPLTVEYRWCKFVVGDSMSITIRILWMDISEICRALFCRMLCMCAFAKMSS